MKILAGISTFFLLFGIFVGFIGIPKMLNNAVKSVNFTKKD
jgi:hypothetical protein